MNFKSFTLSILLLINAQAATYTLTVQKVRMFTTENYAEQLTFGVNWALDSGTISTIGFLGIVANNPITRLYDSEGSVIKNLNFKSKYLFGNEASTSSSTAFFALIDTDNNLKCYATNSLTQKFPTGGNSGSMKNAKVHNNFVLAYNSNYKIAQRINIQSGSSSTITISSYNYIDLSLTQNLSILYVFYTNLRYSFLMYTGNTLSLSPQSQMVVMKPPGFNKGKISYQPSTNLLSRIFQSYIEVYNITQKNIYQNLTITGIITSAVLCNRYIVLSIENIVYFYETSTLTLKFQINSSTLSVVELKCFEEQKEVGASYRNFTSDSNPLLELVEGLLGGTKIFYVHYYKLNIQTIQQQNQPGETSSESSDQSQSQNQTEQETQVVENPTDEQPISQNPQTPQQPLTQIQTPTQQSSVIKNAEDFAISVLKDEDTKKTLEIMSTFAGAFSFLNICTKFNEATFKHFGRFLVLPISYPSVPLNCLILYERS